MTIYHDTEWGVPVHDDRLLFEMLNLEGAQAGLSWQTILSRRDGYRGVFDNFEINKVSRYDETKREMLLKDERIIRNGLKINAVIENARATLVIKETYGSLDTYLWNFIEDKHLTHADETEVVQISRQMSKDLKKKGFRFLGPTTCLAFMQAVGMVNDHSPDCFLS